MELLFKEEVYTTIGAAIEVHKELGSGFSEAVYQEAFEVELGDRHIPFERQKQIVVFYKGRPLRKMYIADLLCYGSIVVEIKALDHLTGIERAQLINYLKATGMKLGLLINFGSKKKLEWERIIRERE